jgi:hypothetical protein
MTNPIVILAVLTANVFLPISSNGCPVYTTSVPINIHLNYDTI